MDYIKNGYFLFERIYPDYPMIESMVEVNFEMPNRAHLKFYINKNNLKELYMYNNKIEGWFMLTEWK